MSQPSTPGPGFPPPPPLPPAGELPLLPPPQAVLPYATPFGMAPATHAAWRDGDKLITLTRATLPQQCVKCAAPADGYYGQRTFQWYHPAFALLILAGLLGLIALIIIAIVMRKRAVVDLGLCAAHRARRRSAIAATWLLVLGGFGSLVMGFYAMEEYRNDAAPIIGTLAALAMWIAAAVVYTKLGTYLAPSKIDDAYATFKGAGPAFLALFPPAR